MSELDPTPVVDPTPAPAEPIVAPEPDGNPVDATNKIVEERLARQKRSILGKLGVDSLDAAAAALEEARKLKEAQMTEAERVAAQLEAERSEKAALQSRLDTITRTTEQRALLLEMGADPAFAESMAGRLTGDDADAWRADAERFIQYAKATPNAPVAPAAANHLDPQPESEEALARAALLK